MSETHRGRPIVIDGDDRPVNKLAKDEWWAARANNANGGKPLADVDWWYVKFPNSPSYDCQEAIAKRHAGGMGLKNLQKEFGMGMTTIHRLLTRMGFPRGSGKEQLDRQKTQAQIRKKEAEERMRLKSREIRSRLAQCIWNYRRGIPVAATLQELGLPPSHGNTFNMLNQSPAYRSLKRREATAKDKPKKRALRHSESCPLERDLVKAVFETFRDRGSPIETEAMGPLSSWRIDLLLDQAAIECKVKLNHQECCKAIGQAVFYRKAWPHRKLILIHPSDIKPMPEDAAMLQGYYDAIIGFGLSTECSLQDRTSKSGQGKRMRIGECGFCGSSVQLKSRTLCGPCGIRASKGEIVHYQDGWRLRQC